MKYLLYLVLAFALCQNAYAKNPLPSPTFDDIIKDILKSSKSSRRFAKLISWKSVAWKKLVMLMIM